MDDRLITVGRVVGVHGVRGAVKVLSHTDPIANIGRYRPWQLVQNGEVRSLDPIEVRANGQSLVARIKGIEDRDAAQVLVGADIQIRRSQLPPPTEGEVYWVDLEGMAVFTEQGVDLGTVSHVFATAANDVLVVQGERQRMLPYVLGTFVKKVDLERREIVVDWDPEF